ncbi:MAG: esterase family protein [Prevotellaceae bacterium]|nr:esterase family protein [Candidatus Faecinaster equi]
MKKILLLSIVLLQLQYTNASRIVTDSIYSDTLKSWVKYNVYLPNGYNVKNSTYPVLYLLHGLSDNYTAWDKMGKISWVADELITSGEAKSMIIIMPNAGDADIRNVHCGYFNVPEWNYENFFFTEFIPTIEKKYNAGGKKELRAISGLSMGGGGSIVYCQRHPEIFNSCYAMSPWLEESSALRSNVIDAYYYTVKSVYEHSAIKFLENATDAQKQQLRSVRWFIDCGDDDFLAESSERMHMAMRKNGIPCEFRIRNGIHNWEFWHTALRFSLPFAFK